MRFRCAHCGKLSDRPAGHVNRSRAQGLKLYCGRRCSGLGRRKPKKPKAQRKLEKRLYDQERRIIKRDEIKAKKRAYNLANYDPEKERVKRKARMPRHVEYCRRPEYKRWKREYDRRYRASDYGPFAEAYLLTVDLNREIKGRMTTHEIKWQNETSNKAQFRRRADKEKGRSRPRSRERRDRDPAAVG